MQVVRLVGFILKHKMELDDELRLKVKFGVPMDLLCTQMAPTKQFVD